MMRKSFFLSLALLSVCILGFSQAGSSPCPDVAQPFCMDEAHSSFPGSSTTGTAATWLQAHGSGYNGSSYACCSSVPKPIWYYMQIDNPGFLNFHIIQSQGRESCDVDFICWGPFTASDRTDFMTKLCNGTYTLALNYCASNDYGGTFPINGAGNSIPIVDCCYCADREENCHIPNAQHNQWYLLLITNYTPCPNGQISFTPTTSSTATTNCQLLNNGDSNSPICEGNELQLICTAPHPGATYTWTLPGTSYNFSTTNEVYSIPNATPDMNGEWQMTMTGISQSSNTAIVPVTIYPTPHPQMASSDNFQVCAGDSVHLSAANPIEGASYRWSVRHPGETNYTMFATNTTAVAYPTENENLEFVLIHTQNECTGVDERAVTINPHPNIVLTVDKPRICYGESATITASGGSHYNWSNGSTASSITVSPTETTNYAVEVKSDALCASDTNMDIIVNPEIIFNSTTSPSYCDKTTGTITMLMTGGSGSFTYNCDKATFVDSTASHLLGGTYTVTATDAANCSKTRDITVESVPGPTACFVFTSTDDVLMTILNCTEGGFNNSYFWDYGDGVTSSDETPIHEYVEPGRYSVFMTVVDENQCTDSLRQDYLINGPVYIPNSFTPNGDGLNDEMAIVGKTIQDEGFTWVIYDRKGSLVFSSITPKISWNGCIFNNEKKPAPAGIYVYHLNYRDVNGNVFEREGSITLIR